MLFKLWNLSLNNGLLNGMTHDDCLSRALWGEKYIAIAKSIDSGQPARTAQADLSGNFLLLVHFQYDKFGCLVGWLYWDLTPL